MRELKLSQIKEICKETELTPRELETALYNGDWSIMDDEEANEAVKEYILETACHFRASFLTGVTGLPEEVFVALEETHSSEAVVKVIESTCGLDEFVESAIGADGRGSFLSSYDGNEIEISGELFLYKN